MSNFKGSLGSALHSSRAWRLTTIVLAVMCIGLVINTFRIAGNHQAILIPYGVAISKTNVPVTGESEEDGNYLSILARADLSALLDWQPSNVVRQTNQFLTRLTPAAYAKFNINLTDEATKYERGNVAEAFYPQTINFKTPNQIIVTGSLNRWAGSEQTLKANLKYTIQYAVNAAGIYTIENLEVK